MNRNTVVLILTGLLLSGPMAAHAVSMTYSIDPRGSYLYTNTIGPPADVAISPLVIDLSTLGFSPGLGGTLTFSQVTGTMAFCVSCGGEIAPPFLGGVFSSSSSVADAVAPDSSVTPLVTGNTYFPQPSGLPTDISQDFKINNPSLGVTATTVSVPLAAYYLLVAVPDSYYADNSSSLGLTLTVDASPNMVPLPAAAWLLLSGLGGLGLMRRRAAS
jgi:hypothetical protein